MNTTTPVRINKELVRKVKTHIKGKGLTISGFVCLWVEAGLKISERELNKKKARLK